MPKIEHSHTAGDQLPSDIRTFLEKRFDPKDIDKLQILGGTIVVRFSTVPKGIKKDKNKKIDQIFLEYIYSLSNNTEKLERELLSLVRPQLKEVCQSMNLPFSSQLTNRELIRIIANRIQSTRKWNQMIDG